MCVFFGWTMCLLSEGDKDSAPSVCTEEGVGRSSQLHLRAERGLQPPVPGTEGRHVSDTPIHRLNTHKHQSCETHMLCVCVYRLSLLRYNTNLTRYKNLLFSQSQQLRAKLAFFKTSIQHDLEQYTKQRTTGICEFIMTCCCDTYGYLKSSPKLQLNCLLLFFIWSFRKNVEDVAGKRREGWKVHEGRTVVHFTLQRLACSFWKK